MDYDGARDLFLRKALPDMEELARGASPDEAVSPYLRAAFAVAYAIQDQEEGLKDKLFESELEGIGSWIEASIRRDDLQVSSEIAVYSFVRENKQKIIGLSKELPTRIAAGMDALLGDGYLETSDISEESLVSTLFRN